MTEMSPERIVPEWEANPATCKHCAPHQWHALVCADCFCETSCLAATLIIPAHIELGDN